MSSRRLIIAIDGPSGAGKGTVAREIARRLGYRHLDTGAMYRAVAWLALRDGVALTDEAAMAARASVGRANASFRISAALRVWVTEVRPALTGTCAATPKDDRREVAATRR